MTDWIRAIDRFVSFVFKNGNCLPGRPFADRIELRAPDEAGSANDPCETL
jgi:hypothetical protein